jgi:hypothetical protein
MNLPENIFIKHAKYIADYRIAFLFTDGHSTEVDFHNFLAAPGQNPMASQFLDVIRFKKFKVEKPFRYHLGRLGNVLSFCRPLCRGPRS